MNGLQQNNTDVIKLEGQWRYALDPEDIGEREGWHQLVKSNPHDTVKLPGTLTLNGVGHTEEWSGELNRESVRSLRQRYSYKGAAWYQYELRVPAEWEGKRLLLYLERVMFQSALWVNGQYAGGQDSLSVAHQYDVTSLIKAGESNRIIIRIDNRDVQNIGIYPSAYTEETQSIWNGVVGRLELQASESLWISGLQLFPDPVQRAVTIKGVYHNATASEAAAEIVISAQIKHGETGGGSPLPLLKKLVIPASSSEPFQWHYELGAEALLWDEFTPNVYELKLAAQIRSVQKRCETEVTQTFGLRSFGREGRQLTVNGRPAFLRGTLECCIFPLTGHPPMETGEWLSLFGTVKAYGLNHIRFHSWCPPEAAFHAADQLGVYVQAEGPMWMDTWNTPVGAFPEHYAYLPEEARRILDAYGNHPSFCIYSNGNELNGDFKLLHKIAADVKQGNDRQLFTLTTNWDRPADPADDLFCAQTVDGVGARGQYFPDELAEGTRLDFQEAVGNRDMPVITHEVGQYTVYPDVEEIDLYNGALRPVNLEVIAADLKRRGLYGDVRRFVHGSGMLALQLYREEIEAALRTPELGGFQLLDLHDFPGQSTATVGILNAFWESKGFIQPEEFRRFCGPVVLLLRMPKRIYTTEDRFEAEAVISNFGACELPALNVKWTVADGTGHILDSGLLATDSVPLGAGISIGHFASDVLGEIGYSDCLTVSLERVGDDELINSWPVWVYADTNHQPAADSALFVTEHWDEETERKLEEGHHVLFLAADGDLEHVAPGTFYPVFWSPVHFATENPCGIAVRAGHPALAGFPTREYAEFQWKDLLDRSVSFIIGDGLPFNPIVQVIPNFYHNRKLANLAEYRVGKGKLMICGIDIQNDLGSRPAASQLRRSLESYMNSPAFAPEAALEVEAARDLLRQRESGPDSETLQRLAGREIATGREASCDSMMNDAHGPLKGNDGIGSTKWLAGDDAAGHWWQVDLGDVYTLAGTKVKFHQEGNFLYVIQVSSDGAEWHVVTNQTGQTSIQQERTDPLEATGRFVKIVYNGVPAGIPAGHYAFEVYSR
jgi:hypothetical protein